MSSEQPDNIKLTRVLPQKYWPRDSEWPTYHHVNPIDESVADRDQARVSCNIPVIPRTLNSQAR